MFFGTFTYLDLIFIGIIAVSTIFALLKGLAREIISLVALVAGFILAVRFYQIPAAKLTGFTSTESIANFLAFLFIFLGCIVIGIILAFAVNRMLKAASLKGIDRLFGAVFGFIRGWAISLVLVIGLVAFPLRDDLLAKSFLAPFLLGGAQMVILLVPQNLKDEFNKQYEKVLNSWETSKGR
ncbi:MAG TPA: CvpA family protein [Acidobacteriota bacterium]|nr:CvpA family protein [Acidobacteriota bacterium]